MTPLLTRPTWGMMGFKTSRTATNAILLPVALALATAVGLAALFFAAPAVAWLVATGDPALVGILAIYLSFVAAPIAGWWACRAGHCRVAWFFAAGALLAGLAIAVVAALR
ncbi:MAG: hypothetical protein JWP92_2952 [Caulobacter sp.]|nr:hypothetical protein [Caulobacter sp.]